MRIFTGEKFAEGGGGHERVEKNCRVGGHFQGGGMLRVPSIFSDLYMEPCIGDCRVYSFLVSIKST